MASRPRTPDPDPDWSLSESDVSPKSQPRSRRQTTSAPQKPDGPPSPGYPDEDEDEEEDDSGEEAEDEDDYYDDDDVSPKSIPRDRRKPKKAKQEQSRPASVKEDQQQQAQTATQRQELAPAPIIEQRHGPVIIGQDQGHYHHQQPQQQQQNGVATRDYADDLYTADLPDPVPPLNLDKPVDNPVDNDSEIESVASVQNNYRNTIGYSPASTPDHSSDESINLDQLSAVFSQKKPPELEEARTPLSEEPPSPMQSRAPDITAPLTHPNGTAMFPDLTASEQDFLSRDALGQAEDEIIADSNLNTAPGSSANSDAGYESDGAGSTGTTSMESSIRDYMYENGRRYHRFREGVYAFPNDDVEQEREDMKHAMVKLLCSQKLHFAPIGSYPQEILDIGTGTGIWAIEMGESYSSANVLGIDLSPIQPEWLPPNVRFMIDDVESPWLYPGNHFDYIHSRHTVMAIKDWMRLFRRSYEHIRPGGWLELQEIHHSPHSAAPNSLMSLDHPVARYWSLINEGLRALGVDFHAAAGGRLAAMMHEAGYMNVTERVLHVPIGTWPKNKVLKTVGLYWRTILLDGLQAIALGPLTRGLGWNAAQVELFLMDVRRAYMDNGALMYMPLHIVYGQKPTHRW